MHGHWITYFQIVYEGSLFPRMIANICCFLNDGHCDWKETGYQCKIYLFVYLFCFFAFFFLFETECYSVAQNNLELTNWPRLAANLSCSPGFSL